MPVRMRGGDGNNQGPRGCARFRDSAGGPYGRATATQLYSIPHNIHTSRRQRFSRRTSPEKKMQPARRRPKTLRAPPMSQVRGGGGDHLGSKQTVTRALRKAPSTTTGCQSPKNTLRSLERRGPSGPRGTRCSPCFKGALLLGQKQPAPFR